MVAGWRPDGGRIYCIKAAQRALQLWTMNADGTDAREVIDAVLPSGIAVTGDGRIVYGAAGEGGACVWRANLDGSARTLLTADADPRWLAASSDGASSTSPRRTWRIN